MLAKQEKHCRPECPNTDMTVVKDQATVLLPNISTRITIPIRTWRYSFCKRDWKRRRNVNSTRIAGFAASKRWNPAVSTRRDISSATKCMDHSQNRFENNSAPHIWRQISTSTALTSTWQMTSINLQSRVFVFINDCFLNLKSFVMNSMNIRL